MMTDHHIDREEELLEKEVPPKKREDLVPSYQLLETGEEVEAFNMSDAATYLGMQRANLNAMLKRLEKQGKPVQVYGSEYGGIERFLLKRDLDKLRTIKPINNPMK